MRRKKRNSSLEHKLFWLGLAATIILPLAGMLTGMFTLELATTGKAYQTVSYKPAGSELYFEVKNIEGLKDLTITFLEDAENMIIEFEEIDKPSWKFDGAVYSQFKIFSEDASKIGDVNFTLKLKETELNRLGLNKDEVKLYSGGQELETRLTNGVWPRPLAGYVYYKAVGNQVGEFVIGKAVAEEKEAVAEEQVEEVAEVLEEEELEVLEEEIKSVLKKPAPVKENIFLKTWLILPIAFFVFLIMVLYLLKSKKQQQKIKK